MKLLRSVALVLLAAGLGAPAALADFTPYSTIRLDNPEVNEAVAAMSSSDIHGTFNRLSALFIRRPIRGLATGDGNLEGAVPENFVRGYGAALIDLHADLGDAIADGLAPEHLAILLQVVHAVAVRRVVDVYDWVDDGVVCEPSEFPLTCPDDPKPDAIEILDELVDGRLREIVDALIDHGNELNGGETKRTVDEGAQVYNASSFGDWVDIVLVTIPGVPHIEY